MMTMMDDDDDDDDDIILRDTEILSNSFPNLTGIFGNTIALVFSSQ